MQSHATPSRVSSTKMEFAQAKATELMGDYREVTNEDDEDLTEEERKYKE